MNGKGALDVGYVLKMYPRLSETFILSEILGLEQRGVRIGITSLHYPNDGRFHAELASVKAAVQYLDIGRSPPIHQVLRALVSTLELSRERWEQALRFLEHFPDAHRSRLLAGAIPLAIDVRNRPIRHLHAHFMTIAAHVSYLAHVFTGVPFSVTAHAKDIYRQTVDKNVFREVTRAAKTIVTVCEANRRHISSHLTDGEGRIEVIYNGVDRERIRPDDLERDAGLLLGVGRLVPKKGFHLLVEACAVLQRRGVPFSCAIVGDGECAAELRELADARELGPALRFIGSIPRNAVLDLMQRARVLVAPCVADDDGNQDALPTVILEALAVGLPVVTTEVAGIPEMVDHGVHGLLISPSDPDALADGLALLLRDTPVWTSMSRAGPERICERFDRERTLDALSEVFGLGSSS